MPIDYKKYPPNWKKVIRPRILRRANNKCEGSPKYPECRALNGDLHPKTYSKVVLTIAHLDHDPENWDITDDRLKAWCQRCHLAYDKAHQKEVKNTAEFKNQQTLEL